MRTDHVAACHTQLNDLGGGEVLSETAIQVIADAVVVGRQQIQKFERETLTIAQLLTQQRVGQAGHGLFGRTFDLARSHAGFAPAQLCTANTQQFEQLAIQQMTREVGVAIAIVGHTIMVRIGHDLKRQGYPEGARIDAGLNRLTCFRFHLIPWNRLNAWHALTLPLIVTELRRDPRARQRSSERPWSLRPLTSGRSSGKGRALGSSPGVAFLRKNRISAMPTPQTRTPPRQRATLVNARSRQTRRALILAALALWSEGDFDESYETSTAADIAHAAGVSKGTFYFHFASKEEVLLELSLATVQLMVDDVDKGVRQGLPLQSLTLQVMTSMARRVARAPKAAALRAGALGVQSRLTQETAAKPRIAAAFESLIRHGVERGELNGKIDVEDAAAMLSAVSIEAINRWGAGDRSASWLRQALCGRAEIVLRGLGMPASSRSAGRRAMKSATARR